MKDEADFEIGCLETSKELIVAFLRFPFPSRFGSFVPYRCPNGLLSAVSKLRPAQTAERPQRPYRQTHRDKHHHHVSHHEPRFLRRPNIADKLDDVLSRQRGKNRTRDERVPA